MIYELALLPHKGAHCVLRTDDSKTSHGSIAKELLKDNKTNHTCSTRVRREAKAANRYAILTTSRETHGEAVSILYAQPLHFKSPSALVAFLAEIGPSNRSLLRDVTVMNWTRDARMDKATYTLLADSAKTLKRLHIDGTICYSIGNESQETITHALANSIF